MAKKSGIETISKSVRAYAVHVDNIMFQEGFLMRDEISREQVESLKKQIVEYVIETQNQNPKPYGVHTPITGFYMDGKLALNHGHHRVTAVRELWEDGTLENLVKEGKLTQEDVERIVNIPTTRVAPPLDSKTEALLYLRQITDNSGRNYSPMECARTCQHVETKFGLSQAEIAQYLGKSVSQISNWLKLMDLPEQIQENISEGTIASTLVNELVRDYGETEAVQLIQKAVEKAKSNGNKKVTKKDVDPNKITRKQIKELILNMSPVRLEDGTVIIQEEHYNALISFFE